MPCNYPLLEANGCCRVGITTASKRHLLVVLWDPRCVGPGFLQQKMQQSNQGGRGGRGPARPHATYAPPGDLHQPKQWYYLDMKDVQYGPYSSKQMLDWEEHFTKDLRVKSQGERTFRALAVARADMEADVAAAAAEAAATVVTAQAQQQQSQQQRGRDVVRDSPAPAPRGPAGGRAPIGPSDGVPDAKLSNAPRRVPGGTHAGGGPSSNTAGHGGGSAPPPAPSALPTSQCRFKDPVGGSIEGPVPASKLQEALVSRQYGQGLAVQVMDSRGAWGAWTTLGELDNMLKSGGSAGGRGTGGGGVSQPVGGSGSWGNTHASTSGAGHRVSRNEAVRMLFQSSHPSGLRVVWRHGETENERMSPPTSGEEMIQLYQTRGITHNTQVVGTTDDVAYPTWAFFRPLRWLLQFVQEGNSYVPVSVKEAKRKMPDPGWCEMGMDEEAARLGWRKLNTEEAAALLFYGEDDRGDPPPINWKIWNMETGRPGPTYTADDMFEKFNTRRFDLDSTLACGAVPDVACPQQAFFRPLRSLLQFIQAGGKYQPVTVKDVHRGYPQPGWLDSPALEQLEISPDGINELSHNSNGRDRGDNYGRGRGGKVGGPRGGGRHERSYDDAPPGWEVPLEQQMGGLTVSGGPPGHRGGPGRGGRY